MSLTGADKEREGVSDTLVALSKWPYIYVKWFKHYVINGLKFKSVNDEANKWPLYISITWRSFVLGLGVRMIFSTY